MRNLYRFIREFIFPGWLAIGQLALGGAGLANSLFGGGGPSPGTMANRTYTPTDLPGADQGLQSLMNQYSGQAQGLQGQIDPAFLQSLQQQLGINYNPLIQAGQQAGQAATGYGNALEGMAGQQMMAGNQLYQNAFDPQNALFNQQQNQVTNQANAINSMYGLGSSAAGAGNTQNALSNFDINWQNNQLGREMQGIQGMTGANQAAGQFAGAAPNAYLAGGQLPLSTQITAAQGPASAAAFYSQNLQQGMNPELSAANQYQNYLNYGSGAQNSAFNQNLAANNYNANQTYGAANSLFQGLGGLGAQNNGSGFMNFFGGGEGNVAGQSGYNPSAGLGATSAFSTNPNAYSDFGPGSNNF